MSLFKTVIILFISFTNFSAVHSQRVAFLSKLTNDIIENERVPSILYAKTCWSKADDIDFIKYSSIPIQIANSITPVNLPTDDDTNKQWFFIDMNCKKYSNFLSNVDGKYFAHPYRWILIDAKTESIQHLNFLPGSNIILANQNPNSKEFTLNQGSISFVQFLKKLVFRVEFFSRNFFSQSAYKIGKGDSLIYENFGHWNFQDGLHDFRPTRVLSRRRRDLRGYRLIAPMVFITNGSEEHKDLDDFRFVVLK